MGNLFGSEVRRTPFLLCKCGARFWKTAEEFWSFADRGVRFQRYQCDHWIISIRADRDPKSKEMSVQMSCEWRLKYDPPRKWIHFGPTERGYIDPNKEVVADGLFQSWDAPVSDRGQDILNHLALMPADPHVYASKYLHYCEICRDHIRSQIDKWENQTVENKGYMPYGDCELSAYDICEAIRAGYVIGTLYDTVCNHSGIKWESISPGLRFAKNQGLIVRSADGYWVLTDVGKSLLPEHPAPLLPPPPPPPPKKEDYWKYFGGDGHDGTSYHPDCPLCPPPPIDLARKREIAERNKIYWEKMHRKELGAERRAKLDAEIRAWGSQLRCCHCHH